MRILIILFLSLYLTACGSSSLSVLTDTDSDGIIDIDDTDDDNDSVLDIDDAFPLNDAESIDTDNDGIGNNEDNDDDGDTVLDGNDAFPLDKDESIDSDGDGLGNNEDTDDDGDSVLDVDDDYPLDPLNNNLDGELAGTISIDSVIQTESNVVSGGVLSGDEDQIEFTIIVSYQLSGTETGVIHIGGLHDSTGIYRILSSREVAAGSGSETFVIVTEPYTQVFAPSPFIDVVAEESDVNFSAYANIIEGGHADVFNPLDSDRLTIPVSSE